LHPTSLGPNLNLLILKKSIAISPDKDLVASGGADKTCQLWDIKTGELQQVYKTHEGDINDIE
jgi:WD40 repeat protein